MGSCLKLRTNGRILQPNFLEEYGVDYIQIKIFYADLAASHPIKAFFLDAPQRY